MPAVRLPRHPRTQSAAAAARPPPVGISAHAGAPLWLKITAAEPSPLLWPRLSPDSWSWSCSTTSPRATAGRRERDAGPRRTTTTSAADPDHGHRHPGRQNGEYGTAEDSTGVGNSDVMMLMTSSADNKRVSVISFPRDLKVAIPQPAKTRKQRAFLRPAAGRKLNAAMPLRPPAAPWLPSTR